MEPVDVFIKYDSNAKDLVYSVDWQEPTGVVWYVKSGLSDKDLEVQNTKFTGDGYAVFRQASASFNGKKHIVLWTRKSSAPARKQ